MDAIESGIVKVPRTPVDDDAVHPLVTYLWLWDTASEFMARMPWSSRGDHYPRGCPAAEREPSSRTRHTTFSTCWTKWSWPIGVAV